MPVTAPNRISLRQNTRGFNPRRPEKSQVRARCAWRAAVFSDPRYSPAAKAILGLLDDWAGWGGMAYPKHATLARQMGRSRQSVQRWVAELERGGAIERVKRAGRAVVYALRWASEAHRRASQLVNNPVCMQSECAPRTEPEPRAGTPDPEPSASGEKGPERECPRCGGAGWREYVVSPSRDYLGRIKPGRRMRGICGCRDVIGDYAR